jgi:hypothetical protein
MARITIFISHAHGESELAALLKERLVQDSIGLTDIFVSSDFKSIELLGGLIGASKARGSAQYIRSPFQPTAALLASRLRSTP